MTKHTDTSRIADLRFQVSEKMPINHSDLSCLFDRIEALEAALREVFEEWAGSEGFIPETAPEGYMLQLTKRMADIARAALEG